MPSANDVAQYILEKRGPMTTMKLQKLVYYSQVWSTVWNDDCLFPEQIEAWKNGPVIRSLWQATRGQFRVNQIPNGDSTHVWENDRNTIDRVLDFYGNQDAQWLSDLTHMELPWIEAYQQGQNTPISLETISEYYSTLPSDAQA